MNTVESMQALIDGKRVRRTCWSKDNYAVVSSGGVVTRDGYKAILACDGEWEIYEDKHDSFGQYELAPQVQPFQQTASLFIDKALQEREVTDVEDFIAKTSNFEPADLFVGGMDGYVHWAGWGISIKNDIPVTLTVRDEIYDVVPRAKPFKYTPTEPTTLCDGCGCPYCECGENQ